MARSSPITTEEILNMFPGRTRKYATPGFDVLERKEIMMHKETLRKMEEKEAKKKIEQHKDRRMKRKFDITVSPHSSDSDITNDSPSSESNSDAQ